MLIQLTLRSKKAMCAAFLSLLVMGTGGCGSGVINQKPYSPPEEAGGENPFVRVKIPEEKPDTGQESNNIDRQTRPLLPEPQTPPSVKHIGTQATPHIPLTGQKTVKDKKEAPQVVHVELAFDNADLYEVLDVTLYDLFGLSYMVDPTLKTTVTFHIKGDFTRDQFINAFNQALQLNNLAIVRGSGNIYKVMPKTASAGALNTPVTVSDASGLVGDITRLIRLRYVSAESAAANVTPFLSKGAQVVQDKVNNALLITDTAENISRAVGILGVIDVEYFSDLSWQIFPLKEVDASVIATDLDSVLQAGGLFKRQGAAEGSFEIFPIKSMNAILVVSRWPSILTLVQDWLAAMDHATDTETNVYVYFVENASALDLADVMQQVFPSKYGGGAAARSSKSSATKTGTSIGGGGRSSGSRSGGSSSLGSGGSSALGSSSMGSSLSSVGSSGSASSGLGTQRSSSSQQRSTSPQSMQTIVNPSATGRTGQDESINTIEIIPDEKNNAIVFKANSRDAKRVMTILKQLDIQPRQVLINVLIAEITLSGSTSYGIEWFLNKNIGSLGGSSGDYTAQGALDSGVARPINTPLGTSNGFFFTVYDPTNFMRGLVSLLGSDSDVNILSSPNILALDNTPAVIEVGQDVPTVTGTTTSATAGSTVTNTVQYRKIGVLLTVIPHINSSGLVKLELGQEVSNLGPYQKDLNNYIFLSRRADTSLVVENNQTIVMGGMMTSNKQNSNSGIPYLKDIPVLGYLFGGVAKSNSKTELLFLITPHVIRNKTEADEMTREFAQKVAELKSGIKQNQ